ncbi:ABC-type transporter involved in resistance to organic solvents, permease protein [Desulfamplus magnetovallimortis]|uniref:ABC-type transporter involved in resistance to organic solvents, permease protein n=1 Tax=Desulfamplus magnetovallimortis TaxID=1246637 RepID=A0A1W1HDA4_9BACT|nr:ABC transporter permease [Desulfamplus magnetovallimortis]SLM30481.1 ABC-type transporter involved in resistance to organic solvents, permease protein [Desulfamplus magnetovallimortis]
MITESIRKVGSGTIDMIEGTGRFFVFLFSGIFNIFTFPFQLWKIIEHTWFMGARSMGVILLTGTFTGMVLGLQGYYTLTKFGSEGMLGSAVALTLIRELGPVLTAIMITARAGSAIAAEIGVMRISEQIDALETMDINPVRFVFSPRLVAALISFPLLTALFDAIGIFGGFITGSWLLGINAGIYIYRVADSVVMADITGGFVKSFAFAITVTTICCYRGFFTHLQTSGGFGAKGVSSSTTRAVVNSCVLILILDYIITYLLL